MLNLPPTDVRCPDVVAVRRKPVSNALGDDDVQRRLWDGLERSDSAGAVAPGRRIAIAVGSRGLDRLPLLVRTVVRWVLARGASPFLVPAMGSHGGATPGGQQHILKEYGITADAMGAELRCDTDIVRLGTLPDGMPVMFSRVAYEADGVVVINRVKSHTDFHSDVESGLSKMLAVGLGKPDGARSMHKRGAGALRDNIGRAAQMILEKAPVLLGVAVVEDELNHLAVVEVVPARDIPATDRALLVLARGYLPRMPASRVDVLIVDEMGKEISGTGMDTNVIGRMMVEGQPEPDAPSVERIVVLDLTDNSCGNCLGIGLADFTTLRVARKIDYQASMLNVMTSTFLQRGKIPLIMKNDYEAVLGAIVTCHSAGSSHDVRLVRIKNTARLSTAYVSPAVIADWESEPAIRGGWDQIGAPEPLRFCADGRLRDGEC